jgi:hypothetical protein
MHGFLRLALNDDSRPHDRYWPIASFRGVAEFGRYLGIADSGEPSTRRFMVHDLNFMTLSLVVLLVPATRARFMGYNVNLPFTMALAEIDLRNPEKGLRE